MNYKKFRRSNPVFYYLIPPEKFWKKKTIEFRHISLFGMPGSGKTTTVLTLANKIKKAFEKYMPTVNFYFMRGLSLEVMLSGIPKNFNGYMLMFIDDAEVGAPSRNTIRAIREMQNHDMVRHSLEKKGMKRGVVALIYATQRFRNLAPLLRNAPIFQLFCDFFKGC